MWLSVAAAIATSDVGECFCCGRVGARMGRVEVSGARASALRRSGDKFLVHRKFISDAQKKYFPCRENLLPLRRNPILSRYPLGGGRMWDFLWTLPKPTYFFVLTQKSMQKKSRLMQRADPLGACSLNCENSPTAQTIRYFRRSLHTAGIPSLLLMPIK